MDVNFFWAFNSVVVVTVLGHEVLTGLVNLLELIHLTRVMMRHHVVLVHIAHHLRRGTRVSVTTAGAVPVVRTLLVHVVLMVLIEAKTACSRVHVAASCRVVHSRGIEIVE